MCLPIYIGSKFNNTLSEICKDQKVTPQELSELRATAKTGDEKAVFDTIEGFLSKKSDMHTNLKMKVSKDNDSFQYSIAGNVTDKGLGSNKIATEWLPAIVVFDKPAK